MKISLVFIVIFAVIFTVSGNQGSNNDQSMTAAELTELINDYKDLYNNNVNSENAPIKEMAMKTKDLTMKYFKTVGIEIAKHMCGQLDNILRAYNNFGASEVADNDI